MVDLTPFPFWGISHGSQSTYLAFSSQPRRLSMHWNASFSIQQKQIPIQKRRRKFCKELVGRKKILIFYLSFFSSSLTHSCLLAVWPDLVIFCTLGNFLKPLATINLPKSLTLLGNFRIGVKSYHFGATFIDIWQFFSGHTGCGWCHRQF